MSNYPFALVALTTDLTLGNEIAAALDPDDGSGTFGGPYNKECRTIGSTGPATAWPAKSLIQQPRYQIVQEFIAGGHPSALLAAGFTQQRLDEIRNSFRNPQTQELMIVAGDRWELENELPNLIASNGYEVIPKV